MRARTPFIRAAVIALIVGVSVAVGRGELLAPMRQAFTERAAPFAVSIKGATGRSAAWARAWFGGGRGEWEAERTHLLAKIAALEGLRLEHETFREALSLRDAGEEGVIPASVVAFVREGRDEFLMLNRGTADGVGVGDIILDRNRVLGGTVVAVGGRISRALLLSSASRSTDVLVAGTELRAIARGANARELIVELVPKGAPLQPGDLLVASSRAAGGRSGFIVGEVREVDAAEHEPFQRVRAIHRFDASADTVLVLLAP